MKMKLSNWAFLPGNGFPDIFLDNEIIHIPLLFAVKKKKKNFCPEKQEQKNLLKTFWSIPDSSPTF